MILPWGVARAHGPFPRTTQILFDPTDPDVLFVPSTFGILVSKDGGGTWDWICFETMDFAVDDAVNPEFEVMENGDLLSVGRTGLWRGQDLGCQWDQPDDVLANTYLIDLLPRRGDKAEALILTSSSLISNFISQTEDNGETWTTLGQPLGKVLFESIGASGADPVHLHLSSTIPGGTEPRSAEMYRSTDGGLSFEKVSTREMERGYVLRILATSPEARDLLFVAEQSIFTSEVRQLLRSDDGGKNFTEVATFAGRFVEEVVFETGDRVWVVGVGGTGLWLSTDRGASFDPVNRDVDASCLQFRGDELWVCGNQYLDGFGVGRSLDGGKTFDPVFRFDDIRGPLSCENGEPIAKTCEQAYLDLQSDLSLPEQSGVTPEPMTATRSNGGSCSAAPTAFGRKGGWQFPCLGILAVFVWSFRRRV
ncbi:MAG: hypothetical protein KC416_04030 [Myxococcales bacterium]|nr:hypothetical protein [Myxococcales bacterium]